MTRFEAVKRGIVAEKSHVAQALLVVAGIALATGLRWLIDRGANGVPFATFLPIIVLAAIFLDWRYAVLAAVASLVVVAALFMRFPVFANGITGAALLMTYALTSGFQILVGHALRGTILEVERQSEQIRLFNDELQHRTRNALQLIKSLASRAARATDPADFYRTLSGRLDALAKANELLGVGAFRNCDLAELVRLSLQAFPQAAVSAHGAPCTIAADAGMPLIMALHELGTNAMKYGALSVETGRVTLEWRPQGSDVALLWREAGGPPVARPAKRGMGSRILSPNGGLKVVDLDFAPAGLVCRMTVARAAGA